MGTILYNSLLKKGKNCLITNVDGFVDGFDIDRFGDETIHTHHQASGALGLLIVGGQAVAPLSLS